MNSSFNCDVAGKKGKLASKNRARLQLIYDEPDVDSLVILCVHDGLDNASRNLVLFSIVIDHCKL